MTDLKGLLKSVSDDRLSGSSEIYSGLLNGLSEALTSRPSVREWKEFSLGLSQVKRSMAPVQNVAGSIKVLLNAQIPEDQFNGFVRGFLMDMREREMDAPRAIARFFHESHRPKRVVTLSYSSTVLSVLSSLPDGTEVRVAESLPLGEGRSAYRKLEESGKKVAIFRDAMISLEVAEADLAVVGADGVCPEGLVNKVGTHPLALACREQGKPMVAVCSTSKLIPVLEMDRMSSTSEVEGLNFHEAVFEMTPLPLFTSLITEEGPVSGEDMRQRLLKDRAKMKSTDCQEC